MKGRKTKGPSVDTLLREVAALTARLAKAENTIIALRAAAAGKRPAQGEPETGSRLESMVRVRTRELTVLTGELHAEIRDRMRIEETLLAEKAYREAVENCLVAGIVVVDTRGRHTHVNDAFCAMTGFRREELLGIGIPHPYWPPQERKRYAAAMRKVLKGETAPGGLEFRFTTRDGRGIDVLLHASPLTVARRAVGSLASVHDITDRKRIESALRESEEKFQNLVETVSDLVWEVDRNGVYTYVSPSVRVLLGFDPEELLGKTPFDLMADKESRRVAEIFGALFARRDPYHALEMVLRHRDGRSVVIETSGAPFSDADGEFRGYRGVDRDITARVRMEEEAKLHQAQLIHANRMTSLGRIVSGVAHEVNNPNNLIMFNAPMILSAWVDAVPVLDAFFREKGDFSLGGLPYSEMREVVPKLTKGISDASARIKTIVGNLKDYTRQNISRHQAPVQLNDVVRMAVIILNHEILRATHRFEVEYGEDLPTVMGSAQPLEQVVINLLNNAIEALPSSQRRIRVSTRAVPETGEVEVCVEDEGVGMSPEMLERIKEPFFSTHLDSGGLGLGVSICRSIVQEYKGTLFFVSEVGKGTRAVIRFPGIGGAIGSGARQVAAKIPSER